MYGESSILKIMSYTFLSFYFMIIYFLLYLNKSIGLL